MEMVLNEIEIRVLGCLIEKEMTTPDYYPLTLNALTNACNQKSNRDPVLGLEETDVVRALDALRLKGLAMQAHGEGSRVPKYRHSLAEKLFLEPEELAILCELFLRGPQTIGELRGRADRMHSFEDLTRVEAVLQELMERQPPLAVKLPRQPGRKEHRYAHLLGGEPEMMAEERSPAPEAATLKVRAENERIEALEQEVEALRSEVAELRRILEEFRSQFE
jgi:uncharacterized protein YceH (UPF0502 family)